MTQRKSTTDPWLAHGRKPIEQEGLACRSLPTLALSFAFMSIEVKAWAEASRQDEHTAIAAIEATSGGRLGVAAFDTGSGRQVTWRADERFPMCSTYKLLTGAAVLARVNRGEIDLARIVPFGRADLLDYAPVTRRALDEGSSLTVDALCIAAIRWSDNTAANLLTGILGGPAGWTAYVGSLGDDLSRLNRSEPNLNEALPDDLRDTTTPAATLNDLGTVLLGDALSVGSRTRLRTWMADNELTNSLLRAGLPAGWKVADKSGAGERGTRNDVGVIHRPGGMPILVGVFCTGSERPMAARDGMIADVARIIAGAMG